MPNMSKRWRVRPGRKIRLADWPTDERGGMEKDGARARIEKVVAQLPEWQYRLYSENRRALLIVLQAMDAGGKDGVIRRVMSVLNPQGCRVTSFKAPTAIEMAHDFLWRIHAAAPARGEIGIFNRSHYEDVLIARVRNLVPPTVWKVRYRQINDFERLLAENGVTILKFFLHISKEEQRERLQARLQDPTKHWKMDPADLDERRHWDDYMAAYEDAIERCGTAYAPWYVIPSDRKWYRDFAVSEIILETLRRMRPRFPPPKPGIARLVVE